MEDMLSEKYASIFLTYLLAKREAKKGDFREVIKSTTTIDKLVTKFEQGGFITVEKEFAGRRIHVISLTPKGRSVAEQLKRAEEAASGVVIHEEEGRAEIRTIDAENWAKRFQEDTKGMSLLYHVNVFEDHITIGQEINGKTHITNIYVRVNGKGIMRLWCEEDESFECIHVQYAWTLPKVQEMYANNVKNGNVTGK